MARRGRSGAGQGIAPKKRVMSVRRRKASLDQLPEMPVDILYQVFQHLQPSDLLNLSRATKALRSLLMHRSSGFLWRQARQLMGIPACPSSMDEPQYANLWFDTHCHRCLVPGVRKVLWEFRVRYCKTCKEEMLSDACKYHRDLPGIPDMCRGPLRGLRFVYHKADIAKYTAMLEAAETEEEKEQVMANQRALCSEVLKHAKLCEEQLENLKRLRQADLVVFRERRVRAITARLEVLGWAEEIKILGWRFSGHKLVKRPQELTDRIWQRISPELIGYLETSRSSRLRTPTLRKRLQFLQQLIETSVQDSTLPLRPHAVDLSTHKCIRDIVDVSPFVEIEEERLAEQLTPLLPDLIANWTQHMLGHVSEQLRLFLEFVGTDVDPLHLATAVFECLRCREIGFRYPDVWSHSCFVYRNPNNQWTKAETYEALANQVFDRCPFSVEFLGVEQGTRRARGVIEACGMDPFRVTSTRMDLFGPTLGCKLCSFLGTWGEAVDHSLKCHLEMEPSRMWRHMPEAETSPLDEFFLSCGSTLSPRNHHTWICTHCRIDRESEVAIFFHCAQSHQISPTLGVDYCHWKDEVDDFEIFGAMTASTPSMWSVPDLPAFLVDW